MTYLLAVAVLTVAAFPLVPCGATISAGAYAEETPAAAGDPAAPPSGGDVVQPAEPGETTVGEPPGASSTAADAGGKPSPWAFSLGLYVWLPGVDAELGSGPYDASADASIVDIFEATQGIPLTIGGRLAGWWKRFGLYVDGNYFYLNFEDQDIRGVQTGVLTQIGLLEYSAMFRIVGAPAGEDVAGWAVTSGPPRVDLYAGGRTTWLKNEIVPQGLSPASNESTLTSPLLGARITVDLHPRWFFHLDGNVGGFGVDDVDFIGKGLATFGYRTKLFGAPMALSLGYTVLYLDVEKETRNQRIAADVLLHGPILDLTFSW